MPWILDSFAEDLPWISFPVPCREEVSQWLMDVSSSLVTNQFLLLPMPILNCLCFTADQDTCDATQSEDGSKCVWCTIASFGVCVSEAIAEKMKGQIPGLECDDDSNDDDATDDETDDKAPVTDDTPPNDDSVPGMSGTC
jgi:hypothetical protein